MIVLVSLCGRDVTVTVEREADIFAALIAMDLPFAPASFNGALLSVKSKYSDSGWVVVGSVNEAVALLESDPDASGPPRLRLEPRVDLEQGAPPARAAAPAAASAPVVASGRRSVRHIKGFGRGMQLAASGLGVLCSAVSVALFLYHYDGGAQPLISENNSLKAGFAGAVVLLLSSVVFFGVQLRSWAMASRFQLSADWVPTLSVSGALCWVTGAALTVVGLATSWTSLDGYYDVVSYHNDRSSMYVALFLSCGAALCGAFNSYVLFQAAPAETMAVESVAVPLSGPEGARRLFVALLALVGSCLLTTDDALDVDVVVIAFVSGLALAATLLVMLIAVYSQPLLRDTGSVTTLTVATLAFAACCGLQAWLTVSITVMYTSVSNSNSDSVNAGAVLCIVASFLAAAEELYYFFSRPSAAAVVVDEGNGECNVQAGGSACAAATRAIKSLPAGLLGLSLVLGGLAAFTQQSNNMGYRNTWNGVGGDRFQDWLFVVAAALFAPMVALAIVRPELKQDNGFKIVVTVTGLLNVFVGAMQLLDSPRFEPKDDEQKFEDYASALWASTASMHAGAGLLIGGALVAIASVWKGNFAGLEVDAAGCRSAVQGITLISTLALAGFAVGGLVGLGDGAIPFSLYTPHWYYDDDVNDYYYGDLFYSPSRVAIVLALVIACSLSIVLACVAPFLHQLPTGLGRFLLAMRLACAVGLLALGLACLVAYHDLKKSFGGYYGLRLPETHIMSDYVSGALAATIAGMIAGVSELVGLWAAAVVVKEESFGAVAEPLLDLERPGVSA